MKKIQEANKTYEKDALPLLSREMTVKAKIKYHFLAISWQNRR